MRRIFLLSFWLLSADTDFELRKTFFHNFWNVYISLAIRFSELLKFPLPAAPSAALAAPERRSLPRVGSPAAAAVVAAHRTPPPFG